MSLRTVGFDKDGRAIRIDEGPSGVAGPAHISGSLVVGGPGAVDRHRAASIRTKSKRAALVAEPGLT